MTAAKQAKAAGLKSLTQVSKITGQSLQTLGNWSKHKPELFAIVLLGCKAKIDNKIAIPEPSENRHKFTVRARNLERCHECGKFVTKKELAKVPINGVPWCDNCVSACD